MKKVLFLLIAMLSFCSIKAQTKYAISIQTTENGTVMADKTEAAIGETVTLTLTPNSGFAVDEVTVAAGYEIQGGSGGARAPRRVGPRKASMWYGQGSVEVTKVNETTYTFTLPESFSSTLTPNYAPNTEFKVYATFKDNLKRYAITVVENEDGTIETDLSEAAIGETVTITITPDEGFMVDKVTVNAGYEPQENEGPIEADAPARRAPRKASAWAGQGEIEVTKVDDATYTFTLPSTLPGPVLTEYADNTEFKVSATFKELLILANKADNTSAINEKTEETISVKLADRTFSGNNIWNTLCLPFNLTIEGSILEGADVRELASSSFSKGVLELTFETVEAIVAGKPYIIRWDGDDLFEPVFEDVKIADATTTPTTTDYITFIGTYTPVQFVDEDRTKLFVGTDNKLYYPDGVAPTNINSQRCYFQLADGYAMKASSSSESDGVKFRINIEEDDTPTSITDILNSSEEGEWFDISGRKVNGKPATKGIYINNGHKFIIK